MGEVWKDIEGYKNLYQVSNAGNVRSLDRSVRVNAHGGFYKTLKGVVLNPSDSCGYHDVVLSKIGIQKDFSVHRLVAEAFIPNPENLPMVNHIDEVRNNNKVENLEWCTHQYNLAYGSSSRKIAEKLSKKVQGTHILTGEKIEFPSTMEAGRNGFVQSSVSECCNGRMEKHRNYKWKFKTEKGDY